MTACSRVAMGAVVLLAGGLGAAQMDVASVPTSGRYVVAENLCGANSLGIVCALYGEPVSQEELCRLTESDLFRPCSMSSLVGAARALGLECDGVALSVDALKGMKQPLIIHLRAASEAKTGHFAVLYGYGGRGFAVLDPSAGVARRVSASDLAKVFSGHAVRFYKSVPVANPADPAIGRSLVSVESRGRIDLGVVNAGSLVCGSFEVTNEGDSDLTIEGVRSGCGCLTVWPGRVALPPHKSKCIRFEWDVGHTEGPIEQGIWLYTDDARQPVLRAALRATAVRHFVVQPPRLLLRCPHGGEGCRREVVIASLNSHHWEVSSIEHDLSSLEVRRVPADEASSRKFAVGLQGAAQESGSDVIRFRIRCRECDEAPTVFLPVTLELLAGRDG